MDCRAASCCCNWAICWQRLAMPSTASRAFWQRRGGVMVGQGIGSGTN